MVLAASSRGRGATRRSSGLELDRTILTLSSERSSLFGSFRPISEDTLGRQPPARRDVYLVDKPPGLVET
jgi:hypothetical protein